MPTTCNSSCLAPPLTACRADTVLAPSRPRQVGSDPLSISSRLAGGVVSRRSWRQSWL